MVNTPQKNLKNANSEQVANTVMNDMKSMPNHILGQIVNLLYLESSNNLAAITIQINTSENIIVLAKNRDVSLEKNTIEINNIGAFQEILEEAFNYRSLVNISFEDNQIASIVRIVETMSLIASVGARPPRPCPFMPCSR